MQSVIFPPTEPKLGMLKIQSKDTSVFEIWNGFNVRH